MTEEQMLKQDWKQQVLYGIRGTWYTGFCTTCSETFFTKNTKAKVCSRKCQTALRGQQCYAWKGGRVKTAAGYIMLSSQFNHPKRNSSNQVAEHILVMEKRLGRYLYSFESVHHINGIRSDNRPENLELWTTYQPYGQRVEDLIEFIATNYRNEMKARLA